MDVSKSALKAKMLEYFRKVEETGEELIVTDNNRPVLCVVPFRARAAADTALAAQVRVQDQARRDQDRKDQDRTDLAAPAQGVAEGLALYGAGGARRGPTQSRASARLHLFDAATQRQRAREAAASGSSIGLKASGRGWSREELYERGSR